MKKSDPNCNSVNCLTRNELQLSLRAFRHEFISELEVLNSVKYKCAENCTELKQIVYDSAFVQIEYLKKALNQLKRKY